MKDNQMDSLWNEIVMIIFFLNQLMKQLKVLQYLIMISIQEIIYKTFSREITGINFKEKQKT